MQGRPAQDRPDAEGSGWRRAGGERRPSPASIRSSPAQPVRPRRPTASRLRPTRRRRRTRRSSQQAEEETTRQRPDATGIGKMRWPVRGRVISNTATAAASPTTASTSRCPRERRSRRPRTASSSMPATASRISATPCWCATRTGWSPSTAMPARSRCKRGEKVKRGQEIARSGMSGTTDAPKLHFEVRKNSAPVDPSTYPRIGTEVQPVADIRPVAGQRRALCVSGLR